MLSFAPENTLPFKDCSVPFNESPCSLSFILSFYADSWQEMFCLAEPDPPIRLEKMEETTNKISLALEIQEEGLSAKPGRCFAVCSNRWHICTYNRSQLVCCTYMRLMSCWNDCDRNVNEDANLERQRRNIQERRLARKKRGGKWSKS